jgi:hypothetical protein
LGKDSAEGIENWELLYSKGGCIQRARVFFDATAGVCK